MTGKHYRCPYCGVPGKYCGNDFPIPIGSLGKRNILIMNLLRKRNVAFHGVRLFTHPFCYRCQNRLRPSAGDRWSLCRSTSLRRTACDGDSGRAGRLLLPDARLHQRQLVERVGALLQSPYTCRQATYDLRRLKRKELITKVAHTNRYQLTNLGRRVAVLFTKTYGRILAPGLSALDHLPEEVTAGNHLSTAWRCFEEALDDFMQAELVAA
jgi:hypothetical protein